ncbi:MAG: hypothetical protein ACYCW6_23190 [Candidatus Xenobia bacterium]
MKFSWGWVTCSFFLFLIIEIALGAWVQPFIRDRFPTMPLDIKIGMLIMLTSFWLGGLVVGLCSPDVRVVEPGVGAFIAVLLTWVFTFFVPVTFFHFDGLRLLIGGGLAALIACWGSDVGERVAALLGNRASRRYARDTQVVP